MEVVVGEVGTSAALEQDWSGVEAKRRPLGGRRGRPAVILYGRADGQPSGSQGGLAALVGLLGLTHAAGWDGTLSLPVSPHPQFRCLSFPTLRTLSRTHTLSHSRPPRRISPTLYATRPLFPTVLRPRKATVTQQGARLRRMP